MLKQINKGISKDATVSEVCITCDKKDYCITCDARDWGCSGLSEVCIFKDIDD